MSEFKELDLSTLQKVWVRVQDDGAWKQRWLIRILDRDCLKYLCIDEYFKTTTWNYCQPYKEPTKRPMTDREIFNALKKEDCWLRDSFSLIQLSIWKSYMDYYDFEITYDGGETWQELEVEE